MFVGIYGIVKGMIFEELKDSGVYICFGNIFYLMLCLGMGIICQYGDLYDFMNWDKFIFIDLGGFQVFSFGDLCKIIEEGVIFCFLINGEKILFMFEKLMEVQCDLGFDIVMIFDECMLYFVIE